MLRSLLLSALACIANASAYAADLNTDQYAGVSSEQVANQPEIQALIRAGLGPHDTQIAAGFFNRGVDMPAEVGFSKLLLLHACKAHDCGVNEVKIVILPDKRVFANLMIDGHSHMFGVEPVLPIAMELKIP